jgi:hypothetical protein
MNILPMVFVFISILTSLAYFSICQTQWTTQQQKICCGFFKAEQALLSARHKKIFKASKGQKKQLAEQPSQKSKPLRSKSGGAFNLQYLFDPATEKMATFCIESILKNAYGSFEPFAQLNDPGFLKEFLSSFKKEGKKILKNNPEATFLDLFPKDPVYEKLYYKMLKGTFSFQSTSCSYPPLEKIFILKKDSPSKFFSFSQLSYQQLNWVFGPAIGSAIEKKEKAINDTVEKGHERVLTKNELEQLLLQAHSKDSAMLISSISFHKNKSLPKSLQARDPSTHITLVWEDKW